MQINTDQWYARWFLWSCRVLDRWRNGNREFEARFRGTNLCQFFRTLVWASLVSAWSIGLWAYIAFVLLVLPFLLFNVTTVAMAVGIIAVAALVGIATVVIVLVSTPEVLRWAGNRLSEAKDRMEPEPNRPPSFLGVCWAYAVGIKQRFCPTITFKEKDRA